MQTSKPCDALRCAALRKSVARSLALSACQACLEHFSRLLLLLLVVLVRVRVRYGQRGGGQTRAECVVGVGVQGNVGGGKRCVSVGCLVCEIRCPSPPPPGASDWQGFDSGRDVPPCVGHFGAVFALAQQVPGASRLAGVLLASCGGNLLLR